MKVIRIDDKIHEELKRSAKQRGHSLQWYIEDILSRSTDVATGGKNGMVLGEITGMRLDEPTIVADSQEWQLEAKPPLTEPNPAKDRLDAMIQSGQIKRGI
jgi:hypothetical protein